MRKTILIIAFFTLTILISGCATVKGTVGGFAHGIATDTKNTWNNLIKADDWFKENAW